MLYNSVDILGNALVDIGLTLMTLLPQVIIALVIFALGWVCGTVLGRAVEHLIAVTRVDKVLHKIGFDTLSEKAGVHITASGFFGGVMKWLVIVAATMTSAEILELSQVTQLLRDILVYIPNVIIAAVVLIISMLLGDFIARIIKHSVKATGMKGEIVAEMSKWSIIVVGGVFPALTQLRIAQGLVEILFTGVVFAVSLALGLSFGLGGRDAAARAIEKIKGGGDR